MPPMKLDEVCQSTAHEAKSPLSGLIRISQLANGTDMKTKGERNASAEVVPPSTPPSTPPSSPPSSPPLAPMPSKLGKQKPTRRQQGLGKKMPVLDLADGERTSSQQHAKAPKEKTKDASPPS